MSAKISIIIPVHNGASTLRECLQAVCSNGYPVREIIIVDDASTDSSLEIAADFPVEIIRRNEASGPAAARNAGAIAAKGDVLFFIDADVIAPKNTLSVIAKSFDDASVDAITGRFSPRQRYANFSSEYKNLWMHHTYSRLDGEVSLFYTSSAAARRDVFIHAGLFDENYRTPSVEDTDFGHRLTQAGHAVHVNKDLAVEHVKKYSFGKMLRNDFIRSSALTRLFLRRGLLRGSGNSSSVPSSFISSIMLFFTACCLLLTGIVLLNPFVISSAALAYILFLASNYSFLKTLRREKGWIFLFGSFGAITADAIVVGLGIVTGLVGYAVGEKY